MTACGNCAQLRAERDELENRLDAIAQDAQDTPDAPIPDGAPTAVVRAAIQRGMHIRGLQVAYDLHKARGLDPEEQGWRDA